MKIMMYVPSGLRGLLGIGGAEAVTRRLMGALRQRGIESCLMVFGYPQKVDGWVAEYPIYFITPHTEPRWYKPRTWASVSRSAVQIWLAMRQSGCDILHMQGAWSSWWAQALAAILPRWWKLVITLHDILTFTNPDSGHRRRLRLLLQGSDAITSVSMEIAHRAREFLGDHHKPVVFIPNGVEPFWFAPAEVAGELEQPYVLYVGRLDRVKGLDVLLSAWKQLPQRDRDRQLWLVGDGPERRVLEETVRREGLSRSVRFLGAVQDMEQLRALYRGAQALVLPSRSEGLPNVLLEAGACGTVCIGSAVGGIPEVIVDGETGFLVPPSDVEALAGAIRHVLEMSEGERRQMGEQARQRVREHFSLERVVDQYVSLYEQVLRR